MGRKSFLFFFFGIENFMQTGDDYLFEDVIDLIYTWEIHLLKDKTCLEMKRVIQGEEEAQVCDITHLTSSIMNEKNDVLNKQSEFSL